MQRKIRIILMIIQVHGVRSFLLVVDFLAGMEIKYYGLDKNEHADIRMGEPMGGFME